MTIKWQSSGTQMKADGNQMTIRWPSGTQMTIKTTIKWQSSGNHMAIRWHSGGNRVAIGWQSTRMQAGARASGPPYSATT
eukprot:213456-Prymnesium_polylepis.1